MWKPSKAQEKSNFAQTCNLLSQYLKEKGGLGEIGLGMTRKPEPKGAISLSSYLFWVVLLFTFLVNGSSTLWDCIVLVLKLVTLRFMFSFVF
jgi:hypothetical protein